MPLSSCFLDWVLFPNIKRVRLPGTEDMDKEYHQKWFHVKDGVDLVKLRDLYGKEYEEYCERVNRCIPWFKRKQKKADCKRRIM